MLNPPARHFSFAFYLVYLYKTQGGRPAFSEFRWPFCGTRVLVANPAMNSSSLHFTTICLLLERWLALLGFIENLMPNNLVSRQQPLLSLSFAGWSISSPTICSAQPRGFPGQFAFLKPCPLLSALSHRICITNTYAQKFSLLGPLKKWLYCIHATHWIGEPEPERVNPRIYMQLMPDWQPSFF